MLVLHKWYVQRPEEGTRSPGTGAIGGCEPPLGAGTRGCEPPLDAGTQTQIL